jgi:hypothetical protein
MAQASDRQNLKSWAPDEMNKADNDNACSDLVSRDRRKWLLHRRDSGVSQRMSSDHVTSVQSLAFSLRYDGMRLLY